MQWLSQVISRCCRSLVIAVASFSVFSTVARCADVCSATIACSVVCVFARRRRRSNEDNNNDDDDNSDNDSSDWHYNWGTAEWSCTCRVWHRGTARHHCTHVPAHKAQYTPPTPTRRNCFVASRRRRRRRCVHEFATSSRRLPTDSVMWTQPSAVTEFTTAVNAIEVRYDVTYDAAYF